jgi:hypothetical protein
MSYQYDDAGYCPMGIEECKGEECNECGKFNGVEKIN